MGKRWAVLVVLLLLTVALRWPHVSPPGLQLFDYGAYHGMACDLIEHGPAYVWGSAEQWRSLASWWPPLWPAWLAVVYAVTGPTIAAGLFANLLLAAVTCLLLVALGNRLRPGAGWVAGGLWAVSPGACETAGVLASENLALPLLAGCLLLALRRRWVWCGLLCGLLLLTRQAALPVAAVLLLACWLRERQGRVLLAMAGLVALVVLPWSVNRSVVLGGPVLLADSAGWNLYMGTHPKNVTGGMYLAARPESLALRDRAQSGIFARKAVRNVVGSPLAYARGVLARARTWSGAGGLAGSPPPQELCLLLVLALAGSAWAVWRRACAAGMVAAAYWAYAAAVVLTFAEPRFALAAHPLALPLAGAAVMAGLEQVGRYLEEVGRVAVGVKQRHPNVGAVGVVAGDGHEQG